MCRVEPGATSHIFVVHGKACKKSDEKPRCSAIGQDDVPPGRMYVVDIRDLMGVDWKVRGLIWHEEGQGRRVSLVVLHYVPCLLLECGRRCHCCPV